MITDYVELTFAEFAIANIQRCENDFDHSIVAWTEGDWALAAAGEIGEMCNLLKKRRRGENISDEEVGKEIADGITYLFLLCARLNLDPGKILIQKFNEVSQRRGSTYMLPEREPSPDVVYEELFLAKWVTTHRHKLDQLTTSTIMTMFMIDAMGDTDFTEFDPKELVSAMTEELHGQNMIIFDGVWRKHF